MIHGAPTRQAEREGDKLTPNQYPNREPKSMSLGTHVDRLVIASSDSSLTVRLNPGVVPSQRRSSSADREAKVPQRRSSGRKRSTVPRRRFSRECRRRRCWRSSQTPSPASRTPALDRCGRLAGEKTLHTIIRKSACPLPQQPRLLPMGRGENDISVAAVDAGAVLLRRPCCFRFCRASCHNFCRHAAFREDESVPNAPLCCLSLLPRYAGTLLLRR